MQPEPPPTGTAAELPPAGVAGHRPPAGQLPPPLPPTPVVADAPTRPRTLTNGWRIVLALGWLGIMSALGLVANTGDIIGTPPLWYPLRIVPFVLPVATLLALAYDWRHTLRLSFAAAVVLGVTALVDAFYAPAMAAAEAVLTVAALLVTWAAAAGRVRPGPAGFPAPPSPPPVTAGAATPPAE